jgi:hypothetical protein
MSARSSGSVSLREVGEGDAGREGRGEEEGTDCARVGVMRGEIALVDTTIEVTYSL